MIHNFPQRAGGVNACFGRPLKIERVQESALFLGGTVRPREACRLRASRAARLAGALRGEAAECRVWKAPAVISVRFDIF